MGLSANKPAAKHELKPKHETAARPLVSVALRNLLVVATMAVFGLLLLVLAFLLPQAPIMDNVRQSASIFEETGSYPIAEPYCESQMDYFTDALILLEAANQHDSSVLDRALNVYRIGGNPAPTIVKYANDESAVFNELGYTRYWHGYLIYVKPLLCVFSFRAIRRIGLLLQVLLLLCIMWRLVKSHRPLIALGFWLGYVTVSVKALGYCLQYWPVTFSMLITCLAIVAMWERNVVSASRISLLFTVTGAAVNYFDFLTFPLVTLTIPLLLLFALEGPSSPKYVMQVFILSALSWGFAYAFMWVLKWLLATILTGQNVFAEAASAGKYRSMFSESDEPISYLQSIYQSLTRYLGNPFNLAVAAFTFFAVARLVLNKEIDKGKIRLLARIALPTIIAMSFILLWYLAMLEHCWLHVLMVNRHFWTLGFGLSLGAASLIQSLDRKNESALNETV